MNTNFFSSIAALDLTGNLQLTIKKASDDNWIVSVMLHNEQCGDNARKLILPLNLRGTSEELDTGFFEKVATPMQSASGLMVNMEGYMKQLEEAKKHSAMQKEKADKERKEKEVKDKKYKEAMLKADELEKDGKYRDAWMKIPEPSEYPEQADILRKRKSALAAKFSPDLFGAASAITAEKTQVPVEQEAAAEEDNSELNEDEWTDEDEEIDN